ncbi:MAG: hypothetical protein H6598_09740 [Flavobacteriales bacterium]|nr:hypothetical protein [Flavobacteriales bacterium]
MVTNRTEEPLIPLKLSIDENSWIIYVDDEYQDLNIGNPMMCLFLVLNSLVIYQESTDYLDWCNQNGINSSELKWLDYYQELSSTYSSIDRILGEIDPCIRPLDYQLRTGVVTSLRAFKFDQ